MSKKLVQSLQARGWKIRTSTAKSPLLPATIAKRYPRLPKPAIAFLSAYQRCENAQANGWFLTRADFRRKDPGGFVWNEFEKRGLEYAASDAQRDLVTRFWDEHFPFLYSVRSDDDYLAIRVAKPGVGQVVHGCAPEWECPTSVAASFAQFLEAYTRAASAAEPEYPYSLFL